jgi:hypothetical protein
MRSSDRLGGSPSRRRIEQFHEARLVRIARGTFAIWLDPFGMLDPQIVVNLLLELGVGVDLVRHDYWLGETNEFHKRPFIWVSLLQIRAERGTIFMRSLQQRPHFR